MFDENAERDCLPLWIADMDFRCPPAVIKALHEQVDKGIFGYTYYKDGEYYRAVCGWYARRFGWYVNSADVFTTKGVLTAIGTLLKLLVAPGDGVIIQKPVYNPFERLIVANGLRVVNNALIERENGRYEIDFEDLAQKAAEPDTKLMILCYPHNPIGVDWRTDELERLVEICAQNGVTIISDEIHYDLTRAGVKHVPLEMICGGYKNNIITCTAPSKTFNLAGGLLSNIIIHDASLKQRWVELAEKQLHTATQGPFSIAAVLAAYYESDGWLDDIREYLDGNAVFIRDFLREHAPLMTYRVPDATYLGWIGYRAYGIPNERFFEALTRDGRVLLEDGVMFGEEGRGYIRINFACPRPFLRDALERLVTVAERERVRLNERKG